MEKTNLQSLKNGCSLNDVIVLGIRCFNCKKNTWEIIKIDIDNETLMIKCLGCGEIKKITYEQFNSGFKRRFLYTDEIRHKSGFCSKVEIGIEESEFSRNVVANTEQQVKTDTTKEEIEPDMNFTVKFEESEFKKSFLENDLVMVSYYEKCLNCGEQIFKVEKIRGNEYKLVCTSCYSSKKIDYLNLYNNAMKTTKFEYTKDYKTKKANFISFNVKENRLQKTKNFYRDALDVVNSGAIFELQLIDSPKNHVTVGHEIENRTISIAYKEKGLIRTFKYKCHYCQKCKKYFDFGHSFDSQLKANGIAFDTLLLNLSKMELYSFLGNGFESFNSETFLHSQGYKVGYSGASSGTRKLILDRLIEQGLMTISEIKSTINNNIQRFSDRPGYEYAVSEWEDDIAYLNKKIK